MQRNIVELNGMLAIVVVSDGKPVRKTRRLRKGGPGSGNFGHSGRPGVVGGSGGGGRVGGGGGGGASRGTYERVESQNGGTYVAGITSDNASSLDGMGFRPNTSGHPTYRGGSPSGGPGRGRVTISPTPEGSWVLSGTDAAGDIVEPENYDDIIVAAEDAAILAEEGAEAFDFDDD